MRVLHVHHALYVTRLLADGMRSLGQKAETVYFGGDERSRDLTWSSDHWLSVKRAAFPKHVAFLARALRKYDVFHFWARPFMVPALFAPNRHVPFDLALLRRAGKT